MSSPARERQRRSRYDRPRTLISWFGLILGIILGAGGSLYYTWEIDRVEEVDVAPWQLGEEDRDRYLVAVMLDYANTGDLNQTIQRLVELDLGTDPIQAVADVACRLARSGYVVSSGDLWAVRSMMTFYQSQGKSSCADQLIPVDDSQLNPIVTAILPTPTLRPPATKTPTPEGTRAPSPTPPPAFVPTSPPSRAFDLVDVRTFCSTELSGIIEVRVLDFNNQGVPGQPVRVRWDSGQSNFFTGLKPERGPGYADFEMEAGRAYIIEMPGLSDPSPSPLVASQCFTEGGQEAVTSYRVAFRGG